MVALKEGHSGDASWSAEHKRRFANDVAVLRCLDAAINLAKSDHDLAERSGRSCNLRQEIARTTSLIKAVYELEIDQAEAQAIAEAGCDHVALKEARLEVRSNARRLGDGRVEFALQYRLPGWQRSERDLPRVRKLPAVAAIDRWLSRSPLALPEGGRHCEGRQRVVT